MTTANQLRPDKAPAAADTLLFERKLMIVAIAIIVVLIGCFVPTIIRGRIPIHGDLGRATLPFRHIYARCLQAGDAVDWTPELFGGYFIGGGSGHGFYHPLNYLLYRCLPLNIAYNFEILWPIVALAAGWIFFLRRYLPPAAACLGALAASFGLMFVQFMHTTSMSAVLSHLPWLLLAILAAAEATTLRQRLRACAAVAAVVGSQILLGFPQALWFCLVAAGLFALIMVPGQRGGWTAWLVLAVGGMLGLAIGSAELTAMYSMYVHSTRAEVGDIKELPKFIVEPSWLLDIPSAFRSWQALTPTYLGAAPLVLVLWWLSAEGTRLWQAWRSDSKETASPETQIAEQRLRRLSAWALLLTVVTALLATGLKGKLYYLQLWLPLVGSFRAPYRIWIITEFSVAILAAIAFARLMELVRTGRKSPWQFLILPWLVLVWALAQATWSARHASYNLFDHGRFAAGPILLATAALGLTWAAQGRRRGLLALVLISAVDFGIFAVYSPGSGRMLWRKLPTYEGYVARCSGPPTDDDGRVWYDDDRDGWSSSVNCLNLRGYQLVNGYTALYPRRTLDYSQPNARRVARMAWVWSRQRASEDSVAGWGASGFPVDGWWTPIADPLPRVRLVSQAVVSESPNKDLKTIDVATSALATRSLDLAEGPAGTAEMLVDRPGRISVAVDAPGRQLLVVSESHFPGWQVRVDGRPAVVEQVNGDFLGCVVEEGPHRVDFGFAPESLRLAKLVSLFTSVGLFALVLICGLRLPLRPRPAEIPE